MNELEFRVMPKSGTVSCWAVYRGWTRIGHINNYHDGRILFHPMADSFRAWELVSIARKIDDILHGW